MEKLRRGVTFALYFGSSSPQTDMFCLELNNNVIKWKHSLYYCSFVLGIHRPHVDSPQKGTFQKTFHVSLLLV